MGDGPDIAKSASLNDVTFYADKCFLIWTAALVFSAFCIIAPLYAAPLALGFIALGFFRPSLRSHVSSLKAREALGSIAGSSESEKNFHLSTTRSQDFSERSSLRHAVICVPEIYDQLHEISPLMCRARLAHETVHCRYKDFITALAYIVISSLSLILVAGWVWYLYSGDGVRLPEAYTGFRTPVGVLVFSMVLIPCLLSVTRLVFFLRKREFRADEGAYSIIGEDYLQYLSHQCVKEKLSRTIHPLSRIVNSFTHPDFRSRLAHVSDPSVSSWETFYNGLLVGLIIHLSSYAIVFGALVAFLMTGASVVGGIEFMNSLTVKMIAGGAASIAILIAVHFLFQSIRSMHILLFAEFQAKAFLVFLMGFAIVPAIYFLAGIYGANALSGEASSATNIITSASPSLVFSIWAFLISVWHFIVRKLKLNTNTATMAYYWVSLYTGFLMVGSFTAPLPNGDEIRLTLAVAVSLVATGFMFDVARHYFRTRKSRATVA